MKQETANLFQFVAEYNRKRMSKCSFLLVAAFCLGLFQTQTNATPAVPTGLTVAWASFHQVALAWEDDAEASAWRVWRNGELAAETTQDSFFEDGLASGAEWSYSVAAVDAAGVP